MSSTRGSSPGRRSPGASPSSSAGPSFANMITADGSSSSDDDDDDAILRPRGRFAARMQAQNTKKAAGSSSETEGGDDDEVVTTRPRKLMQRRQRTATPEATPQATRQAPASPGLFISPEKPAPESPGLFVSPSKPSSPGGGSNDGEGSDSEDDELPKSTSLPKNARFQALLAKKRQEREARDAEEARKKAERLAAAQEREDNMSVDDDDDDEEDDGITDDEGGRKLTQGAAARPAARKASKKALEEMNRETQRLTRSLQLAHEAKVKKKITKADLFERFNFQPGGAAAATKAAKPSSSRPTTPGSAPQTDAEMKDDDTPPSSPPQAGKKASEGAQRIATPSTKTTFVLEEGSDGELPTLEAALQASAAQRTLDKGKGKATDADFEKEKQEQAQPEKTKPTKRNFRVKLPAVQINHASVQLEDDDDLQIEHTRKSKIDAIFDRIPINMAKESRPMHVLRKLAHIDDPEKQPGGVPAGKHRQRQQQQLSMTVGELQSTLLQRARQQAKLERDRHLETLRAKGIHVQTAEEREQELAQVEDMVLRARKEAEDIMQREREAAKQERKARREAGEEDPVGWDDSDDSEDEYRADGEEEVAELELSGSEENDSEDAEDGDMDEDVESAGVLIDDAAESADESEDGEAEQQPADQDTDEDAVTSSNHARRRSRKCVTILSDDEEEATQPLVEATPRPKSNFFKSPKAPNTGSPSVPTSVLRSATKTFIPGLPVAGPAGLGLTQIFAGTMDDSQAGSAPADSPSQPRPTFDMDGFPESNFSQTAQDIRDDLIMDSQPGGGKTQDPETQGVQLTFSQSQAHGFDTLLQDTQDPSQVSECLEPTQDGGYHNFSPLLQRFVDAPPSTVGTVKIAESQQGEDPSQSPLVRRVGKLRRRADVAKVAPAEDVDAGDEMEGIETDEFGFGTSAFNVMKEAAAKERKKQRAEEFNKKKSKAREMVEDQAEESEDEYAGLGGADGEDSSDDDVQSVKEMIDDETKNNEGDERKIAAFYAEGERAADEKQVEKLFHDITTGALRRKRGGDWDELSDSDDGGEAKRRLKRRQFAKMQRALFADERISKVAENPRNQAFLRTIEDRGSDDDMDFIFAPPPAVPGLESQGSSSSGKGEETPTTIPDSQPQPSATNAQAESLPRPPAHLRRTKDGKKPSNIGDIRESLSNLLDEPLNSSSVIPATELGSDDEDENARPRSSHSNASSNKENRNPRRSRAAVVDRISLKRNSSSNLSSTSRPAFATASSTSGTFKVPALLRRATTNSLISNSSSSSASSTGVTTHNGSEGGAIKIKKTAGKRSGINYFARENERRGAVAEMERRREAKKWKGAEGRSEVVGGLFGGGKFE